MKESRFLSHPEKRNHRRLDVDLDVNLVIDGKRIDTTATNISCGGMFVPIGEGVVSHDTQPPQEIEMIVHLPDTEKPVRVYGHVARCQFGTSYTPGQEGVAIKFKGLYDDNILAIDRFIKTNFH
ncbi:MAG TPA: hypothetical protein DDW49_03245 [Deltaproteobacteria bacterium]|nr:MAG: hypothetical protein A2048_00405 [Deltaproteobacteria bacterium GWA2_45_12]HBF12397.1 hypothetical protein [Deltaproteobacteria bacterium]